MKRIAAFSIALLAVFVLVIGGCAPAEPSATVELKVATGLAETAPPTVGLKKAMDYIVEKSGGSFKYSWYPTGSLITFAQTHEAILTGVCDITCLPPSFAAGRFPLTEILEMPPAFVTCKDSVNEWKFWESCLLNPQWTKEWSQVKVLNYMPTASNTVFAKKAIRSLSDAKGLRICGSGANMVAWQIWGATPVTATAAEAYEMIQKGMADGAYFGIFWAKTRKGPEVAPYCMELGVTATSGVTYMNLDKYKSLPRNIKNLFDEVFPNKINEWEVEIFDKIAKENIDYIKQVGGTYIVLTNAEMAPFRSAAMKMTEDWATKKDKDGLPGTKLLQERVKFLKTYMPEVFK